MGLTKKWDIERTWGSHQALLKSVLEVLKPESAVECGCGNYSTSHLRIVPYLTTIEHDVRWARLMMDQFPDMPEHKWIIQSFQAHNATRINELPVDEFEKINAFYKFIAEGLGQHDLLFVDTFTACRVPAVLNLGDNAKYIIIHDMEPPGPEVYEWVRLDGFLKDWKKYMHKPLGHVGNGHQIPWTGLYSKEGLDLDKLNEAMKPESMRLWNSFTDLVEEEK